MILNIQPPAGYTVMLAGAHDDASAITLQLASPNDARVCANYVAGRWSFHVPQNKAGTARMSREQRRAIEGFAARALAAMTPEWMAAHAAMYA